jgi:hypothetical protein
MADVLYFDILPDELNKLIMLKIILIDDIHDMYEFNIFNDILLSYDFWRLAFKQLNIEPFNKELNSILKGDKEAIKDNEQYIPYIRFMSEFEMLSISN